MVRKTESIIWNFYRVKILSLLNKKPLTISQLSKSLGISRMNIYHHIRRLEKAGLVYQEKETHKSGQPVYIKLTNMVTSLLGLGLMPSIEKMFKLEKELDRLKKKK